MRSCGPDASNVFFLYPFSVSFTLSCAGSCYSCSMLILYHFAHSTHSDRGDSAQFSWYLINYVHIVSIRLYIKCICACAFLLLLLLCAKAANDYHIGNERITKCSTKRKCERVRACVHNAHQTPAKIQTKQNIKQIKQAK